jgi:ApbE superfamily uncharacterized protein (UPF0280 family)
MDDGSRLHLQHGPIDLIIGADADTEDLRQQAFGAARQRFETILSGLTEDLAQHRRPLTAQTGRPRDATARRMYDAARPFCGTGVLTPMIAVAGAVADEVLSAMCAAAALRRAYVNNGGDIALHLASGASFSVAMAHLEGRDLGRIRIDGRRGIGGIATSGASGRSFSLGIADSVTVLAANAATADTAATLIGNAVDLPGHPAITRLPAKDLLPESDLGHRLVVTGVGRLEDCDRAGALSRGLRLAQSMTDAGLISGAALFLQGETAQTGDPVAGSASLMEIENA